MAEENRKLTAKVAELEARMRSAPVSKQAQIGREYLDMVQSLGVILTTLALMPWLIGYGVTALYDKIYIPGPFNRFAALTLTVLAVALALMAFALIADLYVVAAVTGRMRP